MKISPQEVFSPIQDESGEWLKNKEEKVAAFSNRPSKGFDVNTRHDLGNDRQIR